MKKLLSLFLCAAMAASLVAGCSSDQTTESSSGTADNSQQEPPLRRGRRRKPRLHGLYLKQTTIQRKCGSILLIPLKPIIRE